MNNVFLNDWADGGLRAMVRDFLDYGADRDGRVDAFIADKLGGAEILLASYTYEDYSGDAFVLYRKYGKLYEVNGSHCSCYGLEDQWEPEETTVDALNHRLSQKYFGRSGWCDGDNTFANELREVLLRISA